MFLSGILLEGSGTVQLKIWDTKCYKCSSQKLSRSWVSSWWCPLYTAADFFHTRQQSPSWETKSLI